MNGPLTYNITLYQGATFRLPLTWKAGDPATAVNLTGCTARMQVRADMKAPKALITLTTENGGIVLGGAAGTIQIIVTAADTTPLQLQGGVYDLEIIFPGGDVRRLLQGSVDILPEVTRV